MLDRILLEEIYFNLLEEGIEQKIPKLLNLVQHIPEHDRADYIRRIASEFDPSPSSDYIGWILKMLRNNILREEDAEKCRESLELFTRLKKLPVFPKEKRDINSYKNWGDLAETLKGFVAPQDDPQSAPIIKEEGMDLMGEVSSGYRNIDANYKLYIVTLFKVAEKHFKYTEWCVRAPNQFNHYGPPYYYFTRDDKPFTLLHLGSDQCMDTYDRPKDLKPWERDMMESEEMTKYVMENDDGDSALDFYVRKVGTGYDGEIGSLQQQKIEELIASYSFKHVDVDTSSLEDDEYFDMSASGFMPFDFSKMDYEDRKFLEVVKNALMHVNIYPDYMESDNIQDDGVSFWLRYDEQSDYHSTTRMDKTKSFLNELSRIDSEWDDHVENFREHLMDQLMKKGLIGSHYSTFLEKYLPRANFRVFHKLERDVGDGSSYGKIYDDLWMSSPIQMDMGGLELINTGGYNNRGSTQYWKDLHLKHKFSEHPLVAMCKFLAPLTRNQIRWGITDRGTIGFKYNVEYDDDITLKDYVNDLKMAISIDRHWEEYKQQITDFWNKYVLPAYLKPKINDLYDIPDNMKIPILHMYGRKESPGQMHLDFQEKKNFNFLLKRLKILEG